MKKRIYQLDLLKTISLFFVIIVHHNVFVIGDSYNYPYLYITKACVPIYLIVTGFFLFKREKSLKEIWKRVFVDFIIPYLLIWLLGAIIVSIKNPILGSAFFKVLPGYIIGWRLHNMTGYSFHLWYILILLGVYVLYPLLSLICKEGEKETKVRRYIMFITLLANFVGPTIEMMYGIVFLPPFGLAIFDMYYVLYVLCGYELYVIYKNNKMEEVSKKYGLIFTIIGVIACTVFANGNYDKIAHPKFSIEPYYLYNTVPLLILSIGMFLIAMRVKIKNEKIQNLITYLGEIGFVMYAIHCFFVTPINGNEAIISALLKYLPPLPALFAISIFSFIITFIAGSIVSWLIKGIKRDLIKNKRPAIE